MDLPGFPLRFWHRRPAPAAAPAPEPSRGPVYGAPAWRSAAPLQRALAAPELVTAPARFRAELVSWADPSLRGEPAHVVSPEAPSGLGHGLVAPVSSSAPAPVPGPAPAPVQRQAAEPAGWRRLWIRDVPVSVQRALDATPVAEPAPDAAASAASAAVELPPPVLPAVAAPPQPGGFLRAEHVPLPPPVARPAVPLQRAVGEPVGAAVPGIGPADVGVPEAAVPDVGWGREAVPEGGRDGDAVVRPVAAPDPPVLQRSEVPAPGDGARRPWPAPVASGPGLAPGPAPAPAAGPALQRDAADPAVAAPVQRQPGDAPTTPTLGSGGARSGLDGNARSGGDGAAGPGVATGVVQRSAAGDGVTGSGAGAVFGPADGRMPLAVGGAAGPSALAGDLVQRSTGPVDEPMRPFPGGSAPAGDVVQRSAGDVAGRTGDAPAASTGGGSGSPRPADAPTGLAGGVVQRAGAPPGGVVRSSAPPGVSVPPAGGVIQRSAGDGADGASVSRAAGRPRRLGLGAPVQRTAADGPAGSLTGTSSPGEPVAPLVGGGEPVLLAGSTVESTAGQGEAPPSTGPASGPDAAGPGAAGGETATPWPSAGAAGPTVQRDVLPMAVDAAAVTATGSDATAPPLGDNPLTPVTGAEPVGTASSSGDRPSLPGSRPTMTVQRTSAAGAPGRGLAAGAAPHASARGGISGGATAAADAEPPVAAAPDPTAAEAVTLPRTAVPVQRLSERLDASYDAPWPFTRVGEASALTGLVGTRPLVVDRPVPTSSAEISTATRSSPDLPTSPVPAVQRSASPSFGPGPSGVAQRALQAPVLMPPPTPQADVPALPVAPPAVTAAVPQVSDEMSRLRGPRDDWLSTAGGDARSLPAARATGGATDVDALIGKLYDPLVRRLKAELRLDRERAGHVLDLRQ